MYKVYLLKENESTEEIANDLPSYEEAMQIGLTFVKKDTRYRNVINPYHRYWGDPNSKIWCDFGSWSTYLIVEYVEN